MHPSQTRAIEPPSPALVFETLTAYQRSAALRAAIELDLFRHLGGGPVSAHDLPKRAGASERGVRILCDYLTVIGLVQKNGSTYEHTPTSAAFLDPASPACIASTARFLSTPELIEPYNNLAGVGRNGRTSLPGDGTVDPDHPVWVEFAHSMAPMMGAMAGPLASIVGAEKAGSIRVLDIAAGHGLFGIEVAKHNSQARIAAVDWAPVLEVARANARKAGVEERYELKPGSAFEVDYGGPYDLVLLTNFLHHFDRETCVGLLRKVHASLRPGGRAAALEFVPDEGRVSPPIPAAFSLVMLATTGAGDAYTFSEYSSMYTDAGFKDMTAHPVPNGPHTVVIGSR